MGTARKRRFAYLQARAGSMPIGAFLRLAARTRIVTTGRKENVVFSVEGPS
jgi:hypothetical protein